MTATSFSSFLWNNSKKRSGKDGDPDAPLCPKIASSRVLIRVTIDLILLILQMETDPSFVTQGTSKQLVGSLLADPGFEAIVPRLLLVVNKAIVV